MSAPSASSLGSCPHAAEVERCGWSGWESVRLAGGCSSCEVPRGASMEPAVSPGRSTWFRMGAALDATRQALVRRLQRFDRGILLAYSRSSPQPIENAPATS